MKNIKKTTAETRKKALEVLFDDPAISRALSRLNVFFVDHDPNGRRVSTCLLPEDDVAAQTSHDPSKWLEYIHPEDRARIRLIWESVISGDQDVFEEEFRFLVEGEYRWLVNKGTMVYRSADGRPELYIAADRDITEERRLRQLLEDEKERLAQLVIKDDFLNIPNRRYLETKQSQFFIADGHTPVAVLVLDIDNFKQLNTHLTHQGGDGVLQLVVSKIQTCLRDMDILARYGGDEFVLILPQATIEYAQTTAQRILDAVMAIDLPKMNGLLVSTSIGFVYGCPAASQGFWDYFEEADTLLLRAKELGKAQIQSKIF